MECLERERLKTELARSLDAIVACAGRFHDAVTAARLESVRVLDQELRIAVAAKEVAFEAFIQHCNDHGC